MFIKSYTNGAGNIKYTVAKLLMLIYKEVIMSKGSGTGSKRAALKSNKGMDKCDVDAHSKQCGKAKKVSKGEHLKIKKEIV